MRKFNGKSNVCGLLIENYRLKNDMSRDIDRAHIYRIEKGIVILKDFELITICKILNIDYTDLLTIINE